MRQSGIRSPIFRGSLTGEGVHAPSEWLPDGRGVLFAAQLGHSTNVWRIGISADEGRITTQALRVTSGTFDQQPSALLDGRIAFTKSNENLDIWSLPIDSHKGRTRGPPERFTGGPSLEDYPSVSDDGQTLAFVSDRSGNWDVWFKDLNSGEERPLAVSPEDERRAVISPDGEHVAYVRRVGSQTSVYAAPIESGTETRLVDIGILMGWTPDSQKVVYYSSGPRIRFKTVDLTTGTQVDIVHHPDYDVHSVAFSPDGGWLSLKLLIAPPHLESTYIAPVRDGKAVDRSKWIRITEGQRDGRNDWSPDSNLLYFWSLRDGSPCLWAQRLAPETKRPVGSAIEIQHFHSPRRRPLAAAQLGLAAQLGFTRDRLYLPITDQTGNIWVMEPIAGR